MTFFERQKKSCDFIKKSIVENRKISHAYLIETNGCSDYIYFIKYFIKLILCLDVKKEEEIFKIEELVDNDNYPDIRYIYPDGNYIKKEQLISLERDFSKKSMFDNKLIYVINEADMLNDSSANSILKFLEEPEENIIAILVTKSRYKIIETILSRCQIISLKSDGEVFDDISEELQSFLKDITTSSSIIRLDYYFESLFVNKQKSKDTLDIVEKIFFNYLNKYYLQENICNILSNYSDEQIIEFMLIINDYKNKLNYNVNLKLWFNVLLIKLIEVNKNV